MERCPQAGGYGGGEATEEGVVQRGGYVVGQARGQAEDPGGQAGREALDPGEVGLSLRVQLHQARYVRALKNNNEDQNHDRVRPVVVNK